MKNFNNNNYLMFLILNLHIHKKLIKSFTKSSYIYNFSFLKNLHRHINYYLHFYNVWINNLDLIYKIKFLSYKKLILVKSSIKFNQKNKNLVKSFYFLRTSKSSFFNHIKFFSVNFYNTNNNLNTNISVNSASFKTTNFNINFNKNNSINITYSFFLNFLTIFKVFSKKNKFNHLLFLKFFINLNDYYNFNIKAYSQSFFSNKYLIKYINFYDSELRMRPKNSNWNLYNNYYPVTKTSFDGYNFFSKKFEINQNLNYSLFTNKVVVKFLENILHKKIFIKTLNNYFYKIKSNYFYILKNEYLRFKPAFFKNFLVTDFIEILWYSFLLKDLKMISNWISKFMESLNFKNHKKFISFFNNFMNKYSSLFIDILGIKGFFFDIRGKVGVTGSSKKRHLCFKFGSLNKSSKKKKINFNQNLVRTYSGVMGLTYIISY